MKRTNRHSALGPLSDLVFVPVSLPRLVDSNFEHLAYITKQGKNLMVTEAIRQYLEKKPESIGPRTFPAVEKIRVTFVVPKPLHQMLKDSADQKAWSVSVLTEEAIVWFMTSQGIDPYDDPTARLLDALRNKRAAP